MNTQTKLENLKNRIALLEARTTKDNGNIVKALKRQVRRLENERY